MKFKELNREETAKFYKDNPTKYLNDQAGLVENATYVGLFDGDVLIAATSYVKLTDHLAMMQSTMVLPDRRSQGVGRCLNEHFVEYLKEEGYHKIVSHIYVDNLPSIILKLKLGYLIEGTLRNHDEPGQHEYILGKEI